MDNVAGLVLVVDSSGFIVTIANEEKTGEQRASDTHRGNK